MHSKYAYRCQFLCGYTYVHVYPHTYVYIWCMFCLNHLCVIMRIHLKGIPASTTTYTLFVYIYPHTYMCTYITHAHVYPRVQPHVLTSLACRWSTSVHTYIYPHMCTCVYLFVVTRECQGRWISELYMGTGDKEREE